MINNIELVKNCTGCLACKDVCPKKCIELVLDDCGFQYPQVCAEDCIDCGACLKVCPEFNVLELSKPIGTFSAYVENQTSRTTQISSSGGIAFQLALNMIQEGGIVYGGSYIDNTGFGYKRCESVHDLDSLRGSKYVNCSMDGVYEKISQDLKSELRVLFIGLPCQVAGVKRRFKRSVGLYTVDLLCHGAPSEKLLLDSFPSKLNEKNFSYVSFREGTCYGIKVYDNSQILYEKSLSKSLYLKGFFTDLYNRSSCYSCQYTNVARIADISLGDFWGVEKYTEKEKKRGISLVLVNSIKGSELLSNIKSLISLQREELELAVKNNRPLSIRAKKSFRYRLFSKMYPIVGFDIAVFLSIPEIVIKNMLVK